MPNKPMPEIKKYKLSLDQLIDSIPKLQLDPNLHQINEIPTGIVIHFLDSKYMSDFDEYLKRKNKSIKIVNHNKAAINISFYTKHKYKLDKTPSAAEVYDMLTTRVDQLNEFINQGFLFSDDFYSTRKKEAQEQLANIQLTLNSFDKYDFAVSNYYRNYTYMYVSFRYKTEDGSLDVASEHLLNSEKDKFGAISKAKQNVIFVDMEYIGVHTPYQNKKIEDYLNAYEKRLDIGVKDVFVKIKAS